MVQTRFRIPLFLPAQGAAETEATIVQWYVQEGQEVQQGQPLAQVDSAKSVFDFESPCAGKIARILCQAGESVPYDRPVLEIETDDPAMQQWIPPAPLVAKEESAPGPSSAVSGSATEEVATTAILGVGGYLPSRVVTNEELIGRFASISADYVYQVTGIRERRWVGEGERPSDLAYRASLAAVADAGVPLGDIQAIVLATTTPDVAMPATACILQAKLGLNHIPAFDINAACSGWLYALGVARGLIAAGTAETVLVVGVDVQSRLLDLNDPNTCFLFGDGAGAAIVAKHSGGHRVVEFVMGTDVRGLRWARRWEPGFVAMDGQPDADPWIRLEGQPLFRSASESFAAVIRQVLQRTRWPAEEVRWVVPHQANSRILRAAAKRSGIDPERFFVNIERVGNTSSASIPLALEELRPRLQPGDKLVLCSVGAGLTYAAAAVEW
ncbi:MAG: beta-ketoacyl-ACP synthase 3 [Thermoguttaceae bacterium]|nr:beta-ketoacyl-ACP synthase 3 [Thermoguttaceae bacterium]MDW8079528.1 beta-ketoacyl-ACP synthase 3 [Thermoguttaceae bacterium]